MSSWVKKETLDRGVQNIQLDPISKQCIAMLTAHLWILIQDNILESLSMQDGPLDHKLYKCFKEDKLQ